MPAAYLYSKSQDFPGGSLDPTQFKIEIEASSIGTVVDNIFVGLNDPLALSPTLRGAIPTSTADRVEVVFGLALSAGELTTLDGNVASPSGGLIALHPQGLTPPDPDPPTASGDPVYYDNVPGGPGGLGLPATDGSQLVNISHSQLIGVNSSDHHVRYSDTEARAASDYAGRFEAAVITTGDIPDTKWGWWWDTGNSQLFLVRNRGNTLYFVETTD